MSVEVVGITNKMTIANEW